jgi:hypothetical protein
LESGWLIVVELVCSDSLMLELVREKNGGFHRERTIAALLNMFILASGCLSNEGSCSSAKQVAIPLSDIRRLRRGKLLVHYVDSLRE